MIGTPSGKGRLASYHILKMVYQLLCETTVDCRTLSAICD